MVNKLKKLRIVQEWLLNNVEFVRYYNGTLCIKGGEKAIRSPKTKAERGF